MDPFANPVLTADEQEVLRLYREAAGIAPTAGVRHLLVILPVTDDLAALADDRAMREAAARGAMDGLTNVLAAAQAARATGGDTTT